MLIECLKIKNLRIRTLKIQNEIRDSRWNIENCKKLKGQIHSLEQFTFVAGNSRKRWVGTSPIATFK